MNCPLCNNELKEDANFCNKCGRKVPRCPTCGKVITSKARFCVNDGTPLPEEVLALLSDAPVPTDVPAHRDAPMPSGAPHSAPEFSGRNRKNMVLRPSGKGMGTEVNFEGSSGRKKSHLPVLLIVVGVLFLAVVGVGGYTAFAFLNGLPPFQARQDNNNDDFSGEFGFIDRSGPEEEPDKSGEDGPASGASQEDYPETEDTKEEPTTSLRESEPATEEEESAAEAGEEDPVVYFIMNCDRKYMSESDLEGFDEEMCRRARNGIYARLGRKFTDQELSAYFLQFDWYQPTVDPDDFQESWLNDYQTKNRDLIVDYEVKMGYREGQ